MKPSPRDKVYPVVKIATIVDLLVAEGIPVDDALADVSLSAEVLHSPTTKISAAQVLQCYRNATKLTANPRFAHHAGEKVHVSTYGMYGFSILSSPNFRESIAFSCAYHQLATPLVEIGFEEQGATATWTLVPSPSLDIDELLYRFIIDLQMAVHMSLHRDVMGSAFNPARVEFSFARPERAESDAIFLNCPVSYGKPQNRLVFDIAWLDRSADLGNELTYTELKRLCDGLLRELALGVGTGGKVREIILENLAGPVSVDMAARRLGMSERSLRRRLQEEGTSFRELVDELRVQVAIRYVRDTELSIENIAFAMGFSDASSFRHAFLRWTNAAPHEYRRARIDIKRKP